MDGDIAMEEWKDPNQRGSDYLMPAMPAFLEDEFPPAEDGFGEDGGGFEKHGLSVAVGSPPPHPREDGHSPSPVPPPTPQFFQKPHFGGGGGSLADRRARGGGGFSNVTKLSVPSNPPAVADVSPALAPSPYVTIPPGLSPTTLLESPIFLSNSMGQASPTTGKLHMHDGADDNDPIRFETPPIEEGVVSGAFSFKPLNLKFSHYMTEAKTESHPNNQHQISVKTEANIQTAQEATNLQSQSQSQLMQQQQQLNGHSVPKSSSSCKPSRPAPDTAAAGGGGGGDGASPPDHGQPSAAAAIAPVAEDGYSWRKYGQKQVKHSEYPRSYYKCTHANCVVKKKVERSHEGHVTEIIYKGTHSHAMPTPPPPPPPPTTTASAARRPPPQTTTTDHTAAAARRPPPQTTTTDHTAAPPDAAGQPWHQEVRAGGEGGLEVTSSPSVPGELCDSTASPDHAVDMTSAASDEVDRGDSKAAHVPPHAAGAGADSESEEMERKRRKLESSCGVDMSAVASRAVREPRVVIQTTSEVDILDDGYRWRKYGQKVVKGNPNPRSYYKCTHPGCLVRKHVERASHDLKSVITTYEGKHNHEVPAARNSAGAGGGHQAAVASSQQHHVGVGGGRRPEVPSVQDSLMRLGCGGAVAPPFAPHFAGLHLPLPPPTTARDPLAPMSNFPYSFGHVAGLPPVPPPAGIAGVEGLKYPMLGAPPSVHPLLRHRQGGGAGGGVETVIPKGEVKQEAMAPAGGGGGAVAGAGRGAAVYQQAMSRVSLGNQL
uniref:WRKY transcription factor WRKY24 n=1 Tax=Leersia perrieri TaxID=77586 RepID=A0A0D9W648_9ORYZ